MLERLLSHVAGEAARQRAEGPGPGSLLVVGGMGGRSWRVGPGGAVAGPAGPAAGGEAAAEHWLLRQAGPSLQGAVDALAPLKARGPGLGIPRPPPLLLNGAGGAGGADGRSGRRPAKPNPKYGAGTPKGGAADRGSAKGRSKAGGEGASAWPAGAGAGRGVEGPDGTVRKRKKHHNPWTHEETAALVDGVTRCGGGKWADIKKLGLAAIERRSAVDLKDKWRNLSRVAKLPPSQLKTLDKRRDIPLDLLARVRKLSAMYMPASQVKQAVQG